MKRATAREIRRHVEAFARQEDLHVSPPTRGDRSILVMQWTTDAAGKDRGKVIAEGRTWAEISSQLAAWRHAKIHGRNPVPPSSRIKVRELHGAEYEEALRLFEDFTGHQGKPVAKTHVSLPKTAMVVGRLDGVLYTTVRDGEKEKYIHRFKARSAPILAASADGRQLFILGGEFRFTERGIVDQ